MVVLQLTQQINKPADAVFRAIADVGNFASWNPTIKASRQLTPGDPANGSRYEWDLKGFGTVQQELQEFEPGRRLRIVPLMKQMSGGHRFTLEALGRSTRVDHELEMVPKGVYKLVTPMMKSTGRKNLDATAAALKRHLEQD